MKTIATSLSILLVALSATAALAATPTKAPAVETKKTEVVEKTTTKVKVAHHHATAKALVKASKESTPKKASK